MMDMTLEVLLAEFNLPWNITIVCPLLQVVVVAEINPQMLSAQVPSHHIPSAFFRETVSPDEVSKIMDRVSSKTCSLDTVPTHLIKDSKDEFLPFLTQLINKSFVTGTVPDAFKRAIIRPLLKKPELDPNELKNYRPV